MGAVTLRPLEGFVVGITADRRWQEQAELLRRRGAEILHGPTMATSYLDADETLRAATNDVIERPPQFLAATTGIGIRAWFEAAQSWGMSDALVDALDQTKIVARGPKSAGAVQAVGLSVWKTASNEQMNELQEALLEEPLKGRRVAVQLYGMAAPELHEALAGAGAEVVEVAVYSWRIPDDPAPAVRLIEAVLDGKVHAVTFTAAPAATNLMDIAAEHSLDADLKRAFNSGSVVGACVGPVCARGAESAGIESPLVPSVGRLGLLVRALSDLLQKRQVTVSVAGTDVVLQGLIALVGADRVALSPRERSLLDALTARPGAVVSRAGLLERVWGSADADPHLVEVLVARLRQRLGAAGAGLRAVPGRGYRIEPDAVPRGAAVS